MSRLNAVPNGARAGLQHLAGIVAHAAASPCSLASRSDLLREETWHVEQRRAIFASWRLGRRGKRGSLWARRRRRHERAELRAQLIQP